MTTRLSRERARASALHHFHSKATELARSASNVAPDARATAIEGHPTSARGVARTPASTDAPRTRIDRLRDRRARISHWRRTAAALGAVAFAAFGSATLAGSAALANTNPAPNSVLSFGAAPDFGSDSGLALRAGVVGIATDPSGPGYWLVGSDGGVFTFGHASYFGSTGNDQLNAPIVGIAATATGRGYWLVGSDGGVFAFGDATYEGSTAGLALAAPIRALVPTRDGGGYWLVGSDGGVFAFGDAGFHGAAEGMQLATEIVGAAATTTGHGYWLVGSDGGVFAFGDATYEGSLPDPGHPAVGIAASPTGDGYWVAHSDGMVSSFGVPAVGTASTLDPTASHPNTVGIAASPHGGYWLAQGAVDTASSLAADPFLACTRAHESDLAGGYRAVSPGGMYRGAYQFDRGTWNSAAQLAGRIDLVGVDPAVAAPADQDLLALTLFHSRGHQPWGQRCAGLE